MVALVRPTSRSHHQLCGAIAMLDAATELDVEITPHANPQPSPTMAPLRVGGQIYEMTPVGRGGIPDVVIYLEWANDGAFIDVHADGNGSYTACGIPRDWPIALDHQGRIRRYVWHRFTGDSRLEIELKRQ